VDTQLNIAGKNHGRSLNVQLVRSEDLLSSGQELLILDVECVTSHDRSSGFLIPRSYLLDLLLNVLCHSVVHLSALGGLLLSQLEDHLATVLPNGELLGVWKPLDELDKLLGLSGDLVVVCLHSEEYIEVILSEAAIYTAFLTLNVQICLLIVFLSLIKISASVICPRRLHFFIILTFCTLRRFHICGGTWSFVRLGAIISIIGD
jgi:hypothetical protein